jgi:tRNA isopentenyl-2-thiomethyl-A-37 hydroxylase MiaE
MTKEQVAEEIGVSVNEIIHHFPRLQERLRKRGIRLIKRGSGKYASYGLGDETMSKVRFDKDDSNMYE